MKTSTVNVRILAAQLRNAEVGAPCPVCSTQLGDSMPLIVFHDSECIDHSRAVLTLKGKEAQATYLDALAYNLGR